jgi:hypothetical protein
MSTKELIESKLKLVSDSFTVNMFDNGFMLEISGQNHEDEWDKSKIVCRTLAELYDLIEIVTYMKRET